MGRVMNIEGFVCIGVDMIEATPDMEGVARVQLEQNWKWKQGDKPHRELVIEGPYRGKEVRSINWFAPPTDEAEEFVRQSHMASRLDG